MKRAAHFILFVALLTLGWPASLAVAQSDRSTEIKVREELMEARIKDYAQVLPKDLQAGLVEMHKDWIAYRDSLCKLRHALNGNRPGFANQADQDGRDIQCLAQQDSQHGFELNGIETSFLASLNNPVRNYSVDLSGRFGVPPMNGCVLKPSSASFEVWAVGTRKGTAPADVKLDDGDLEVGAADVAVTEEQKSVLLVLMGDDPIVWRVSFLPKAKIVGVIATGLNRQIVLGLPKSTPQLLLSRQARMPCSYFSAFDLGREFDTANARVKGMTGQEIASFVAKPIEGRFVVGPQGFDAHNLIRSDEMSLADYGAVDGVPSGQRGIDLLVKQGKLRPATQADADAWAATAGAKFRALGGDFKVVPPRDLASAYVVLDRIELPPGLSGPFQFYMSKDVTVLRNNRRNFTVLYLADGSCTGALCPG